MLVVDSSVAVAAFASWHEHHDEARAVVDSGARLAAHAALETYSVLTRLPPPHRAPAELAHKFLVTRFSGQWLTLPSREHQRLLGDLASKHITGGKVYDVLIAAVAAKHNATLATCDRRATGAYDAMGVTTQFIV
jgi:predicted nucleic acid-binding protein